MPPRMSREVLAPPRAPPSATPSLLPPPPSLKPSPSQGRDETTTAPPTTPARLMKLVLLLFTGFCLFTYADTVSRATGFVSLPGNLQEVFMALSRPAGVGFKDDDRGLVLPPVQGAKTQLYTFRPQSGGEAVELPVYVDEWYDPEKTTGIERVVIHVHGQARDAWYAWNDAAMARNRIPGADGRILIVAPVFFNGNDKTRYHWAGRGSTGNLLVYKGNGWGEGAVNQYPTSDTTVSSFEALDSLGQFLTSPFSFPDVKHLTFSGHSLGGQLIHRYSILGDACTAPGSTASVSFVTFDPATFLYFIAEREGPVCEGMNEYKYGFENLSAHFPSYSLVRFSSAAFFQIRYLNTRSIHLVHGLDDHGKGDERCYAMAQGFDRVDRAQNYHRHLRSLVGKPEESGSIGDVTIDWVPNVAHDAAKILSSEAGIHRVFIDT